VTGRSVSRHENVPPGWDELVEAAGAPVFYRAALLAAYQRRPLQPTLAVRYLTVDGPQGTDAVLPAYLVPARDPFAADRAERPGRMVISHFWHCYDTRLPSAAVTAQVLPLLWAELGRLAAEWDADTYGLLNVATGGPLAESLAATGLRPRARGPRYRLVLDAVECIDAYVAGLPSSARADLRRHGRRAGALGLEPVVLGPPFDDATVDRTVELLGHTEARYNPGYYPATPLAHLLRTGGPQLRVIAMPAGPGGPPAAASVSFVDPPVLHNWAIGVDRDARWPVSPYLVLLGRTVALALAAGCRTVEMGRTNGSWKERFGARPVPLDGWLAEPAGSGTRATARAEAEEAR
jgi:Acetyltransferase (GNAT) domain